MVGYKKSHVAILNHQISSYNIKLRKSQQFSGTEFFFPTGEFDFYIERGERAINIKFSLLKLKYDEFGFFCNCRPNLAPKKLIIELRYAFLDILYHSIVLRSSTLYLFSYQVQSLVSYFLLWGCRSGFNRRSK